MRISLIFLTALLLTNFAYADKIDYRKAPKFALVIGNTHYEGALQLRNAGNDANLINSRLQSAGYSTELVFNTERKTLYEAIGRLADHLKNGGVGIFYYAGHGAEIKERNYLIPVNVSLKDVSTITQQSLPVEYLIQRLKDSGAHLSVILLDACRNDPAKTSFDHLYRGIASVGFAPEKPANGMVIAYATQPGERAIDGDGNDGPFAIALADWIVRPGMPLEEAIKHVMTDVRAKTRDEQRPWLATSLIGNFALVPAAGQRAELMSSKTGQNIDDSIARGYTTSTINGTPITVANSTAKPTSTPQFNQWFESLNNDEQMKLTNDINRQAKAVNNDDLPRLIQQAKGGSVIAQSVLGLAYRQGFGVGMLQTRSNLQAIKWLTMAAQQHLPFALNELGEMFYLGQGVAKNPVRAKDYFEAAAAQNYTPAKLNLIQLMSESGQLDASTMQEIFKKTAH